MKTFDESSIRKAGPRLVETLHFTRRRRVLIYANAAVMIALLLGIVVMVNVIAREHPARFNWTADRVEALSPETVQRLKAVPGDVDIYANPMLLDAEDKASAECWRLVLLMLQEFGRQNPKIKLVTAEEGKLPPAWVLEQGRLEPNSIYLKCTGIDGRVNTLTVLLRELYRSDAQTGQILNFQAESGLISAIWTMASSEKKVVYFTEGHDEMRIHDSLQGMTLLLKLLEERDNVEFRRLDLGTEDAVPRDADLVLVAGARKDFPVSQLDALKSYLEGGGRMMVALDPFAPTPGLRRFLEEWGAQGGRGLVFDRGSCVGRPELVRVRLFGPHPINLRAVTTDTYVDVPYATSVQPVAPAGRKPVAVMLMKSTENSFEDADGNGQESRGDPRGALGLAVAVEGEPVENARNPHRSVPKLIVWGSVETFANRNNLPPPKNEYGMEYYLNNFRWLLELDEVIAPSQERRIRMTPVDLGQRGMTQITFISIGLMPMIGVMLGIMAWWFRRK